MLLDVVLTVPSQIAAGLANGTFTRIGGVIQEGATGQVVTWLRDGSAGQASTIAGAMSPLLPMVAAASMGNLVVVHIQVGQQVRRIEREQLAGDLRGVVKAIRSWVRIKAPLPS